MYFLSYDLRNARDYQPLYDELERFNAKRVLESLWCFNRINTSAAGLRDYFSKLVDADDGLAVVEASNWATRKALATPNNL